VYRVGGGVTAPVLLQKQEPEYTEEARRSRYQGTVLLYVEIDPSGKATNIRVQGPVGMGLNEKAIEAVKAWTFKPGTKEGNPVTVAASIEVNFRMASHWSIARQDFSTAGDAVKPVLRSWAYPPECHAAAARLGVSLDIDSAGAVKAARVLQSSDSALDQGVVDAVQKWSFAPARWQGSAQPVGAEIELSCKP
jgi:TonB family protein